MESIGLNMGNWEMSGTLSAILFIAANAYYPARVIARNNVSTIVDSSLFFENYLKIHIILNLLGVLVALFHGHFADENNIILQISLLLTLGLTVNGWLMYYSIPEGDERREPVIQLQRVMFIAWILVLIIGHSTL